MGQLTPNDVKRWDLGAIQKVFETANGRANTLQLLGENLQQVHNVLSGWKGEAGEAFRADLGRARRDIEADGQESRQVAAAVARAEGDVSACKRELEDIERTAEANGWTITPDWRIDVGDTWIGHDPVEFAAQQQLLQDQLIALNVHAHSADHELAAAVRFAVGEVPLDASGQAPSGGAPGQGPPNPAAGRNPRTLQDMLLPAGPADAGPDGASPKGPPLPAGAVGKPLSLQDMLLPAGPAAPGRGGVPPPRLNSADVESFKAMARQTMIRDGVPPNQIEARLNDVVSQTQQWIDNGMPNYVPPEPKAPPPPGFSEGFSDRWFATEQGIKNLFGQGGPGAPSVLKSWEQMLKGTATTALNPVGTALTEIKSAMDSPTLAYYLGGETSDVATTLPTMLFGGEGAMVRAGLPAEVVTEGGAPLAVVRGWNPTGGMTWDDFASQFGTPTSRSYPLNDGFPLGYEPQPARLPEGAIIDRFGSEYGRYLAPDGAPFADRALAPESVGGDYNRYMVTGQPLPPGWQVVEGPVQPYYGQTPSPGSLQYMILGPDGVEVSVKELVDRGFLDEYGPRLGR
ncbi:glycohydrolase toxin TNT-related protein [Mycobacterium sp. WUMAC-067]|uniref:TNT domain-containing protein n=1 Tax=unclassified Mycobacterium TaxID=2642494 RepID=UPI001CDA3CF6|nr:MULTISPECIES: TNT domain-containing protein [unclassified Mycobacterium]MCA2240887.1 glycohydrolase toxin TNT-related protein [Mycobacterium sp. WUMAC-067]MCA2313141.1 glycohydrolase toxin TNT-related protein [Mycobacterium sp. WUMAC-025]